GGWLWSAGGVVACVAPAGRASATGGGESSWGSARSDASAGHTGSNMLLAGRDGSWDRPAPRRDGGRVPANGGDFAVGRPRPAGDNGTRSPSSTTGGSPPPPPAPGPFGGRGPSGFRARPF